MNVNIKSRKGLYKYFKGILRKDGMASLTKGVVLGKGGQGKVYRYCLSNSSKYCMAVKKMYLDDKESKYLKDIYSDNAYKQSVYIELSSMQLINELVLQNVCPNYILNYDFMYKERDGICDDIYPHTMYYFNEFIDGAEIYTDWVKENHTIKEWYNAYFQITVAIYALQRHFNMIHLDLHSDNIIVIKVKPGGHWVYEIDGEKYYVPNYGYVFYINDFGHAWIPNEFRSWFIRQRYNKKRINKSFDIMNLFRSTFKFSTSPKSFKKHIRYFIKELRGDKLFTHIISEIWGDYKEKISKSRVIDVYDLNKNLNVKNLHPKLKKLVIMK
jgi:hypothetical protein